ncbi:MAG: dependent oxidoreductase, partial [Bacilli bacterium]|nr:dependent oxidoreductase [Bacilli bacterium]
MSNLFSASSRTACLQEMSGSILDVLILGGGITGAGIAWDASLRGMKAGLVEMNDFASGTSSRSTKLIHGGLRYLKQGEMRLVREVGRERTLLHHRLPHLVTPLPMLLPIYKGNAYGPFTTSAGLFLYDRLAGVDKAERRTMLTRAETIQQEPLLLTDDLIGAGSYYEYRTDDARLTLEIIKSAVAAGTLAVNYAQASDLIYESGKCVGACVRDQITQTAYSLYAKTIVNATGPWSDAVRALDHSLEGKKVFLTKGVHLVCD